MNFLNLLRTRRFWQNFMVLVGAVLIPSWLLKESNEHVFPSAANMANGMILIVIIAALTAMITASDERADGICRTTAMVGKVILGAVLFWNLGGHWQLTREVDSAKAGVVERREEETIQDKRERERAEREKELSAARAVEAEKLAQLEKNQSINRDAATRLFQRTGIRPVVPQAPKGLVSALPIPTPAANAPAAITENAKAPRRTPDEVRESWNPSLTTRAYIEAGCGIMLMVILSVLWYADWDGNGIADRIQRLPRDIVQKYYPEHFSDLFGEEQTSVRATRTIGMAPARPSQAFAQGEPPSQGK